MKQLAQLFIIGASVASVKESMRTHPLKRTKTPVSLAGMKDYFFTQNCADIRSSASRRRNAMPRWLIWFFCSRPISAMVSCNSGR